MQQNLRAVSAVSQAIDYIKALPGRKVVVFASRFLLHRSRLHDGQTVANAITDVVAKANRNAVVIYTMHLRGLSSTRGSGPFEPLGGLFYLANETGGRAFTDENNLSKAMGWIMEKNRGYYLLGFKIGEKDPEPAKIKVRVKRKGLRVQARAAAFSSTSLVATVRSEDLIDLSALVNSPLRLGDLELSLAPTLQFPEGGPVVVSYLGLDFGKLQLEDGPEGTKQSRLETVVQVIGPNGNVVLNETKRQGFEVEKQKLDEAGREGLVRAYAAKTAGAGQYQVRASVRDLVSGQAGNASAIIEVPERNPRELYASEVLFGNPREGKITFEPYRFQQQEKPRYGLWVLPGKADKPVEVVARIVGGDQVVATWRPILIDKTTPLPAFIFDLIDLNWCRQGLFTLVVTATQGKRSLERKVKFEVR